MNIRPLAVRASMPAHGEINVTPLIDVLLVLVVILMLSAPMALHRIPLPLASSSGGTAPTVIGLSIQSTGELYLEGNAVNRAQLSRPQATVHYEQVADVLALARRSGLPAIRIEGTRAE